MFGKRGLIVLLVLLFFSLFAFSFVSAKGIQDVFVSITSPTNGLYTSNITSFNWSLVVSTFPLDTCSYDLNSQSTTFNCNLRSLNFTSPLLEGYYNLTLFVNNSIGEQNSNKRSFVVDTISPQVSFTGAVSSDGVNLSSSSIVSNVAVVEVNPVNISYTLYDSSQNIIASSVFSMADQNANTTLSWSRPDGIYYYDVAVTDIANHRTTTERRKIALDITAPVVNFIAPTEEADGANKSQSFVLANVSVVELNEQTTSFTLYNSSGSTINSSSVVGLRSMLWNLVNGDYSYQVCTSDYAANVGCTGLRVISLDTISPIVTLNSPSADVPFALANNTVNATYNYSDVHGVTCSVYLNGTLQGSPKTIAASGSNSQIFTSLAPGRYLWNVSCTDVAGNTGNSETRRFTILSNLTFSNTTTFPDLSAEGNISRVWFWVANEFGIINWSAPVDLSRGLDWALYVSLISNHAGVDASGAPELSGAAHVTLYNLTWTAPQILKDGSLCSDCSNVVYANGTITFDVNGLSTYTTQETPVPSGGSGGSGGGGSSGSHGGSSGIASASVPNSRTLGIGGTNITAPKTDVASGSSSTDNSGSSGTGITGAVIGGSGSLIFGVVALAAITGVYLIVAARRRKAFSDRVRVVDSYY